MWSLYLDVLGRTRVTLTELASPFIWGYSWRYGCIGSFGFDFVVTLFGIWGERRSWASSVSGYEAVCNGRPYSWTYYRDLASQFCCILICSATS
jgi:hypothetical protein